MKTYTAGFDFGNSETCLILGYNEKRAIIPSYTAIGDAAKLTALDIKLRRGDYVYKDDTVDILVGNLALKQSENPSSGLGDTGRYWSEKAKQLLLVSSASLIPEQEYAVQVVTGLPVRTYLDSLDNRKRVKKALDGAHTFMLNGKERTAHITILTVIMEGAGAAISYGNKKGRQGVIDIGGFTIDLFAAEGQEPIARWCQGSRRGVDTASQLLRRLIASEPGGRSLSDLELRSTLRAYAGGKAIEPLFVDGREIPNVKELARQAVERTGKEIAAWVASVWNESDGGKAAASFSKVLLIGGGSYYFFDHIRQAIPTTEKVPDPECANALGYASLAQKMARPS